MLNPLNIAIFAIDRNRWDDIAGGMKPRPVATGELLLVLGALAAIGVVLWMIFRFFSHGEQDRRYSRPLWLFLSLCRAHRLSWSERWLLWQVAAAHRLRHKACLFLEPRWLDVTLLPPNLQSRAPVIERLKTQLFAEAETAATAPDAAGQATP